MYYVRKHLHHTDAKGEGNEKKDKKHNCSGGIFIDCINCFYHYEVNKGNLGQQKNG